MSVKEIKLRLERSFSFHSSPHGEEQRIYVCDEFRFSLPWFSENLIWCFMKSRMRARGRWTYLNMTPHWPPEKLHTRNPFKSSTQECDIFLHPLTSNYNIHAWLDNCFLMLKHNMILGVFTDIIRYLKLSSIFGWLYELLNP